MLKNTKLRQNTATGQTVLNGWIAIPSPLAAEVMASLDWDTVTVDLQHGTADYSDLLYIFPILEKSNKTPLVRVAWLDEAPIMRALDAGAYGIIAPMIENAHDAKRLVSACRYPPSGGRSFGPIRARFTCQGDYAATVDDTIASFAMVETRKAVENLDEILSVEELTGIYIGPADLSFSYGYSPAFDREEAELLAIIDKIRTQTQAAGKIVGLHCGSADYARRMAKAGFDLVTIGSDARFMEAAATKAIETFRLDDNLSEDALY